MNQKENKKELPIETRNELFNVAMNIEKTKDLAMLLGEYFNESNFDPVERMRKEGESEEEILASEVLIFRRYFEEYKTLLFEIIDKLERTKQDCQRIIKSNQKEGE